MTTPPPSLAVEVSSQLGVAVAAADVPPSTGRGKSFAKDDQLLLCKCFLAISEDPIVGRYQKGSTFYRKIADEFNAQVTSMGAPERRRSVESITPQWRDTIQKKVSKFCGCYTKAKAVTRSGWTDQNYIDEALTIYMDSCGSAFRLLHCWKFLQHKPKWVGCVAALSTKKRLPGGPSPLRAEAPPSNQRPVGNKKAKRAMHEHEKTVKGKLELAASIAQSIKTKNNLLREQNQVMQDQLALQLFSNDSSTDAQEFIAAKKQQFLLAARRALAEEKAALAAAESRLEDIATQHGTPSQTNSESFGEDIIAVQEESNAPDCAD